MPKALGGKDEYKNLVIINDDVHRLIHATNTDTIKKYLSLLNLNADQLKRVNSLKV
nr:hypothetical protein [Campylobacter fetus]